MPHGLPRKLRHAFLMQVVMASIVILVGAYAVVAVAKHDIAARALQDEAAYYWQQRAVDPAHIAPGGAMLQSYVVPIGASTAALPESLRHLDPGSHSLPDLLVLVQKRDNVTLYLTIHNHGSIRSRLSWCYCRCCWPCSQSRPVPGSHIGWPSE